MNESGARAKATIDADNPVVKLCVDGVMAEAEGRKDDAARIFAAAWDASRDDFEACLAAHYVARHQATPEATLHWNSEALRRADAIADERVRELYPSLYLNVADSLERVGRGVEACRHYTLAAARVDDLTAGGYASMIRDSATRGQSRTCSQDAPPA